MDADKTSTPPNIVVFGAGSIGCFVGGAWQLAGLELSFIGRESVARELATNGLKLSDSSGGDYALAPGTIDYRTTPDALASADLILLCVKSGATRQAARAISDVARQGATILSLQNGISNIAILEEELKTRFRILRGMVLFNVAHLGEGRFHKGVGGDVYAEKQGPVTEIADMVAAGPAPLRLSDDMLEIAWGKLLINLNNAVNALSGRTLIDELRNRDYRRVFAAAMWEGLSILKTAGITPHRAGPVAPDRLPRLVAAPDWLFNRIFLKRWKIDAKARSSMADDLALGRKTEVDYLNGELVALAEALGIEAPVNRAIVNLVRERESGAGPLEPAALLRAVLGG